MPDFGWIEPTESRRDIEINVRKSKPESLYGIQNLLLEAATANLQETQLHTLEQQSLLRTFQPTSHLQSHDHLLLRRPCSKPILSVPQNDFFFFVKILIKDSCSFSTSVTHQHQDMWLNSKSQTVPEGSTTDGPSKRPSADVPTPKILEFLDTRRAQNRFGRLPRQDD